MDVWMDKNLKVFLLCPIPEDQKPINIYIGLKENTLTSWTTLSEVNYEKKWKSIFGLLFGSVSLVRFSEWEEGHFGLDWLVLTFATTCCLLMFLLVVIFARWKQLEMDFNAPRVFYEESSWYDGQVWEKPWIILKNDRLISTQRIRPILDRLVRTFFTLVLWTFACYLFFVLG